MQCRSNISRRWSIQTYNSHFPWSAGDETARYIKKLTERSISSQGGKWRGFKVSDTNKQEPGRFQCLFPELSGGE